MTQQPLLIIGNKGKTGSRVQKRLADLGYTTRGVSRSSNPSFDWENPATWKLAMKDAVAAYVTYQPDLAIPKAESAINRFLELASEVGIQHIVLLSGRGEEGAQKAERALQQSGIAWNVVRASWFAQNFSESFMLEGLLKGELFLPADTVTEPFVDIDDIADVAVATLTQPKLHNRVFEVTGPRLMTFAQCVQEISAAINHPLKYTPVPVEPFIQALQEQGIPSEIQWLMKELFTVVLDGRNSQITNGVYEALNRPATDFQTYIKKAISSGAWDALKMNKVPETV